MLPASEDTLISCLINESASSTVVTDSGARRPWFAGVIVSESVEEAELVLICVSSNSVTVSDSSSVVSMGSSVSSSIVSSVVSSMVSSIASSVDLSAEEGFFSNASFAFSEAWFLALSFFLVSSGFFTL